MEQAVKQRLIGALVLALLAFIFLPMLVKGPDRSSSDAAQVPLDMPKPEEGAFETRELPLNAPTAPEGSDGVLGLKPAPATAPSIQKPATSGPDVSEPVATDNQPEPAAPIDETPDSPSTPAPAAPVVEKPIVSPAAKPTPLPAVAAGDFVVKVGTFSNAKSADDLVKRLKADGLPASTDRVTVNGVSSVRVKVGPYAERTSAEAARLRANSVSGGSAQIVTADAMAAAKPAAAPNPKPEVKADKPSASASGWAVQLAALASEADANALRDKARKAGFATFVQKVQSESGVRYRVRVGPEADKAAADRLRVAIGEKLGINDAVVRPHP
jgi:DedD protein